MPGFNQYADLIPLDSLRELCTRRGVRRKFRRGDTFVMAGDSVSHIALVCDGYFKYETHTSSGEPCITGFAFPGEYITDFNNASRGLRSSIDIVAGRTSEAMVIPFELLSELKGREDGESFVQHVLTILFAILYERYLNLYRFTPEERYVMLLQNYPRLIQSVPLRDIASYLQVTPVHLSRIRRRMCGR